jgi:hypothetical protein
LRIAVVTREINLQDSATSPEPVAPAPTGPRFLSAFLCGPLGVLAAVVISRAIWLPTIYMDVAGGDLPIGEALKREGIGGSVEVFAWVALVAGVLLLAASMAALAKKSAFVLSLLRKGYLLTYLLLLYYIYVVMRATSVAIEARAEAEQIKRDHLAVMMFFERWGLVWPYLAMSALVAAAHVISWTRKAMFLYTGERSEGPAPGDAILENIRTHGREPEYRKSLLGSAGAHLAIIVIIPILLEMRGCVDPYRVPKGSGNPVIAMVARVKPKKKKRKKYVLRADSAIYFHVPDLDDSEVLKQVDEDSQLTYQADPNAVHGKLGAGGGKTGGWPDGMEDGKVRFIRMKYDGRGWDDGMDDRTRADANFLDFFRKLVPFPVAFKGESHPIRLLAKYPKGYAPPFVYMTGHGSIRHSRDDVKIMREYLLDGGMLFADCGSPHWDRSIRGFIKSVLPDKQLLVIADDDPIFRMPYAFPNGAPPLWHHGGWRALGMKHKGRWCVFYHPGDINDAWKTRHSGLRPELARGAFHMGVNIIYYAFTHYLAETRKYRK